MENNLLNVLLIEDDSLDIINAERELKKIKTRYSLHIAKNGKIALDMLKGENGYEKLDPLPLIILLDINMPKMDGFEFLKIIRGDHEYDSIKVFIMTTSNEEGDKLNAKKLGIEGYIVKPLTFEKHANSSSSLDTFGLFIELLK
jgi:CheY-like chemotaxis protein